MVEVVQRERTVYQEVLGDGEAFMGAPRQQSFDRCQGCKAGLLLNPLEER